MRVHPSILAPKAAKWQFPLAAAVMIFLLGLNLFRGPRQEVVAVQLPQEKKIEVLVAQQPLEAGQPFEKANLAFEQRPVNTLPADAVTTLDILKGKVAAGPIPAGYPLAIALLADPLPVVEVEEKSEVVQEDPIETMMREIEKDTVAVATRFDNQPPPRGTRIAVMSTRSGGGSPVVVLEEAWVARAESAEATLRVDSTRALLFELARSTNQMFRFIEIPTEGPSPFAGKAPQSEDDMRLALGIDKPTRGDSSDRGTNKKRAIRSYAWVPGEGRRFGVDQEGNILTVDQSGAPLESTRLPAGFGE